MQFEDLGNLDDRLVRHGPHLVVDEVQCRQRDRLLPRVAGQVRFDPVLQVVLDNAGISVLVIDPVRRQ